MKRKPTHTIGPITVTGDTATQARMLAESAASTALSKLDRARPVVVAWREQVSLVFTLIMADGEVSWAYTNPRTLAELSADCGRERMGTAGYYQNCAIARSKALSHMIQNDPAGIPDELPTDELHPDDIDTLRNIARYVAECAA